MNIMDSIIEDCRLRGITQRELAEMSGLTEASICRYFKHQRVPNLSSAEKMANALGLTLRLSLKRD